MEYDTALGRALGSSTQTRLSGHPHGRRNEQQGTYRSVSRGSVAYFITELKLCACLESIPRVREPSEDVFDARLTGGRRWPVISGGQATIVSNYSVVRYNNELTHVKFTRNLE